MGGRDFDGLLYRHSVTLTAVYCVAYVIVFIVGLIGNSFVIAVVLRSPRMRTVTNFFIVNLAVADILVIVFCLPATLMSNIFVRKYHPFDSPIRRAPPLAANTFHYALQLNLLVTLVRLVADHDVRRWSEKCALHQVITAGARNSIMYYLSIVTPIRVPHRVHNSFAVWYTLCMLVSGSTVCVQLRYWLHKPWTISYWSANRSKVHKREWVFTGWRCNNYDTDLYFWRTQCNRNKERAIQCDMADVVVLELVCWLA